MARKTPFALAALTVALSATASGAVTPPTEFRLLPYGRFKAADGSGRPHDVPAGWLIDGRAHAEQLAAAFAQRQDARVIDYEHQTLLAETNGKPAPASGWIGRLEARDDGLYAVGVEWTAAAATMIANREYRFVSPVFAHDKKTGRVTAVLHAALTNYAGLDGLTDLAALSAKFFTPLEEETTPMNKELLKALGLPETATEAEALAALAALKSTHQSELAALKASHQGELAALKGAAPDPAKYVDVATLNALRGELATATTELVALRAAKATDEVDQVVTAALSAGKLTPATEKWARDLGAKDLAALKGFIESAPVVVKPNDTQTKGKGGGAEGDRKLNETQLAVCRQMGVDPADYAKTLAAEAA